MSDEAIIAELKTGKISPNSFKYALDKGWIKSQPIMSNGVPLWWLSLEGEEVINGRSYAESRLTR